MRLTALTVDYVDGLIAGIVSEPLRLNVHKTLSAFCQLAEAKGKRPRSSNPCRGVRIGEALGLDWGAVDFDENRVTIDQQATRVKGVQVGNTKSEAGTRVIPMPNSLAEHLKVVKLLGESPHIVSNWKGERRDPARVATRLKALMEE